MIVASWPHRLDGRVKELTQEKEELLKTSKVQATTMEGVKVQIETLLKVHLLVTKPHPHLSSCI